MPQEELVLTDNEIADSDKALDAVHAQYLAENPTTESDEEGTDPEDEDDVDDSEDDESDDDL